MSSKKRKALLDAIVNNDLDKLRKAIGKSLPEKWFCFVLDHFSQNISYDYKLITKEDALFMLSEARKNYNVKINVMHFNRVQDQAFDDFWLNELEPELSLEWRNVTFKLE